MIVASWKQFQFQANPKTNDSCQMKQPLKWPVFWCRNSLRAIDQYQSYVSFSFHFHWHISSNFLFQIITICNQLYQHFRLLPFIPRRKVNLKSDLSIPIKTTKTSHETQTSFRVFEEDYLDCEWLNLWRVLIDRKSNLICRKLLITSIWLIGNLKSTKS